MERKNADTGKPEDRKKRRDKVRRSRERNELEVMSEALKIQIKGGSENWLWAPS